MGDLIVPDESYVSLENANKYHKLRASFEAWDGLDDETKKRRLVSASDYLDITYSFTGEKQDQAQLRQFPRKGFDGIPVAIVYAVCELALQEDLNQNREQKMSSVRVGPISVNYDEVSSSSNVNRFEYVKHLLSVWLERSGSSPRLIRG